jgi:hypothetical protein
MAVAPAWLVHLMATSEDNLELALGGARGFMQEAEQALTLRDYPAALSAMEQVHAHLEWAEEVITTRQRASRRKS